MQKKKNKERGRVEKRAKKKFGQLSGAYVFCRGVEIVVRYFPPLNHNFDLTQGPSPGAGCVQTICLIQYIKLQPSDCSTCHIILARAPITRG